MNIHYIIIYIFVIILAGSCYLGWIPLLIILPYIAISPLTYARYASDKKAALQGEWRVPEKTLHLLSLLGGWPGAIIAQQRLRHKTKKTKFKVVFWLTLLINTGSFGWLHTKQGSALLHDSMFHLDKIINKHINSSKLTEALEFLTSFR